MTNQNEHPIFRRGQRVICVDASIKGEFAHQAFQNFQMWPKEGESYIVEEFRDNEGIAPSIVLREIQNKPVAMTLLDNKVMEPAFATWRFQLHPIQPNPDNDLPETPQMVPVFGIIGYLPIRHT